MIRLLQSWSKLLWNSCLNSLYQWTTALLAVLSNYIATTTAPNVEAFNGLEPQREVNSVAKNSIPSSNTSKRYIIQHTVTLNCGY